LLQFAVCGGHVRSVQAPGSAPAWPACGMCRLHWDSCRRAANAVALSLGHLPGRSVGSTAVFLSRTTTTPPVQPPPRLSLRRQLLFQLVLPSGQVRRASALGLRAVAVSVWLSERGLCEVATVCGLWRPCSFSASAWFGTSLASLRHVSPALGQLSGGLRTRWHSVLVICLAVQSVQLQFFSPRTTTTPPVQPPPRLSLRRQLLFQLVLSSGKFDAPVPSVCAP
jgi:hypothetical protein